MSIRYVYRPDADTNLSIVERFSMEVDDTGTNIHFRCHRCEKQVTEFYNVGSRKVYLGLCDVCQAAQDAIDTLHACDKFDVTV